MPIFICDICHAKENTALGDYWNEKVKKCSECAEGKWHGRFPKEIMTTEKVEKYGRDNFIYTADL